MGYRPERTTEDRFADLQRKIALAYHGEDSTSLVSRPFYLNEQKGKVPDSFTPATEVTLNRDMQDFSPFLKQINILPRKHQKGGSLMIGSQGRVTRTNDTYNGVERRVSNPLPSTLNEYVMAKAHSDFRWHDDDIDAMSEFPQWENLYRRQFMEAMANDRIIIGWHGETASVTSDLTTNPLLQDVNKGFLNLLKERAPSQVMTEGKSGSEEITIGPGGDYANLDHLIQDLYQGIPVHRRTSGMAAMISEAIMGMAEGIYYQEQAGTPSEKPRIATKAVTGVYGGLEAVQTPYMPQTSIVITGLKRNGQAFSNLSIYWQSGSWRRKVEYKAEIESSIDWNARREAYHIEDLNAIVALDTKRIVFLKSDGTEGTVINRIPAGSWQGQ